MSPQLENESLPPQPAAPPPDNNRLIWIIITIGVVAATLLALMQTGLLDVKSLTSGDELDAANSAEMTGAVIGQIQSVEGQVEVRPPRGSKFIPAVAQALVAEAMVQTQTGSAAVIEFQPGPTIRLLANSRLVAELDPTRENTIHATLITGDFTVIEKGESETFTISQGGIPIDYKSGSTARTIPLIQETAEGAATTSTGEAADQENAAAEIVEKMEAEKESELATMPTTATPDTTDSSANASAEESKAKNSNSNVSGAVAAAAGANAKEDSTSTGLAGSTEADLVRSTLTNDDIRTQTKAQAGGFQKCYVSMVNRMTEAAANQTQPAAELPRGEVLVSFKILASGKVDNAAVIRSPFSDQLFDRCIAEALSRIRFRPFQGATIPVAEFPISLE